MIANLCKKYNCIAVMDEVYEWLVFDKNKHIRMGKEILIFYAIHGSIPSFNQQLCLACGKELLPSEVQEKRSALLDGSLDGHMDLRI